MIWLRMGLLNSLHQSKAPEEATRITGPKYYRYFISHPLEKYITLKKHIMQLVSDGRIILDLDDSVGTNHISTKVEYFPLSWKQTPTRSNEQSECMQLPLKEKNYSRFSLEVRNPSLSP